MSEKCECCEETKEAEKCCCGTEQCNCAEFCNCADCCKESGCCDQ